MSFFGLFKKKADSDVYTPPNLNIPAPNANINAPFPSQKKNSSTTGGVESEAQENSMFQGLSLSSTQPQSTGDDDQDDRQSAFSFMGSEEGNANHNDVDSAETSGFAFIAQKQTNQSSQQAGGSRGRRRNPTTKIGTHREPSVKAATTNSTNSSTQPPIPNSNSSNSLNAHKPAGTESVLAKPTHQEPSKSPSMDGGINFEGLVIKTTKRISVDEPNRTDSPALVSPQTPNTPTETSLNSKNTTANTSNEKTATKRRQKANKKTLQKYDSSQEDSDESSRSFETSKYGARQYNSSGTQSEDEDVYEKQKKREIEEEEKRIQLELEAIRKEREQEERNLEEKIRQEKARIEKERLELEREKAEKEKQELEKQKAAANAKKSMRQLFDEGQQGFQKQVFDIRNKALEYNNMHRKYLEDKRHLTFQIEQFGEEIEAYEKSQEKALEIEDYNRAERLNSMIQDKQQAISQTRAKIAEIVEKIQELNNDKSTIPAEMVKVHTLFMQSMVSLKADEEKNLKEFLNEMNVRTISTQERMTHEFDRTERLFNTLLLDIEDLHNQKGRIVERIDTQTKEIRDQKEQHEKERDQLQSEIQALKKQLEAKEREEGLIVKLIEADTNKIQRIRSSYMKQLNQIEAEEKSTQSKLDEFMAKKKELQDKREELNKELEKARNEEKHRKDTIKAIRAQIRSASTKISRHQKQERIIAVMKDKKSDLTELETMKEHDMQRLSVEYEIHQEKVTKIGKQIWENQRQVEAHQKNIAEMEMQKPTIERQKKEAADAKNFKEAMRLSREAKDISDNLIVMKSQVDQTNQILQKQNVELEMAKQKTAALKKEKIDSERESDSYILQSLIYLIVLLKELNRHSDEELFAMDVDSYELAVRDIKRRNNISTVEIQKMEDDMRIEVQKSLALEDISLPDSGSESDDAEHKSNQNQPKSQPEKIKLAHTTSSSSIGSVKSNSPSTPINNQQVDQSATHTKNKPKKSVKQKSPKEIVPTVAKVEEVVKPQSNVSANKTETSSANVQVTVENAEKKAQEVAAQIQSLKGKIDSLEQELQEALEQEDYAKCDEIQGEIDSIQKQLESIEEVKVTTSVSTVVEEKVSSLNVTELAKNSTTSEAFDVTITADNTTGGFTFMQTSSVSHDEQQEHSEEEQEEEQEDEDQVDGQPSGFDFLKTTANDSITTHMAGDSSSSGFAFLDSTNSQGPHNEALDEEEQLVEEEEEDEEVVDHDEEVVDDVDDSALAQHEQPLADGLVTTSAFSFVTNNVEEHQHEEEEEGEEGEEEEEEVEVSAFGFVNNGGSNNNNTEQSGFSFIAQQDPTEDVEEEEGDVQSSQFAFIR